MIDETAAAIAMGRAEHLNMAFSRGLCEGRKLEAAGQKRTARVRAARELLTSSFDENDACSVPRSD
jgi:hypothetical protein